MKTLTFGLAAAALALGVSAASAQPAGGRPGGDANNDGTVTRAEALAQANARWQRLDANGDGVLNQADRQARQAQRFAQLDTNKDGKVSQAEFAARRGDRAKERFTRLDTDKSGGLSAAELAAHGGRRGERGAAGGHDDHAAMGHEGGKPGQRMGGRGMGGPAGGRGGGMHMMLMADSNKDGSTTRAEYDAAMNHAFTMVDTNKDGSITPEERQAAHARMREAMKAARPAPSATPTK